MMTIADICDALTATGAHWYVSANSLTGTATTSSTAELNILTGATLDVGELNILDGVTATAAELNISSDQSAQTETLTADGAMYSRSAAAAMVPVSTTATNRRRLTGSMRTAGPPCGRSCSPSKKQFP